MANERQIHEVLLAVTSLSRKVDRGFEFVDERFTVIDDRFNEMHGRFSTLERGLRNDFGALLRKADQKVNGLLDVLRRRNVITEKERARLAGMGPYREH